ncbi:hypothetical protein SGRA_3646 [Saprospira grandis str. Lewin]|uniref:Uncharacterized protein n=1 Tax=Saprospira grandis (strain Lewin) TaxID=984262 RepID=H6L6T7_SAPGL|nr:hypothetical protein SGRA_3646 [Saprospira grandis str. Lewin]
MVGSAAKPQTKQKLVFCAGPSDPTNGSRRSKASNSELPNVAPTSAARRRPPKKGEKAKLLLLFRPLIAQGDWVGCPDLDQDLQCNFS